MTMILSNKMSNEEYHAHENISSSDLKAVASTTLRHWKGKVRKENPAFDLGTAVHAMLLEPEKELIVRGPETRRGKAWSEAKEDAEKQNKLLLTEADYDLACDMAEECLTHPMGAKLLNNKELITEASFFVTCPETGLGLKTRPDGFLASAGLILDVKTCQDASLNGFSKALRNFNYSMQQSFYRYCLEIEGIKISNFIFIAIEKEKPHATACYELSDKYDRYARQGMMQTLHKIKRAKETGDFSTGWPDLDTISLPPWLDGEI